MSAEAERDALRAEVTEARRAQYQVLWKALEDAGITRGDGCPDSILIEEVERLRAETADLWNKWSDAEEKRERAEAALIAIRAGSIGLAAAGIVGHLHVVEQCDAALRDTTPGEGKRGYAPTDALGDARVEAVEEGP